MHTPMTSNTFHKFLHQTGPQHPQHIHEQHPIQRSSDNFMSNLQAAGSSFANSTQRPCNLAENDGPMLPPQPPPHVTNSNYRLYPGSSRYEANLQRSVPFDQSQLALPPPPPQPLSGSMIKTYRAYFSLAEVDQMVRIQSGKLPPTRVESTRQQACIFIDKVGTRLGFPRRTIASAQLLYHRFHLFLPLASFNPHDVSISALMVASKMQDTLKKLREIQMTAWLVRNIHDGGTGQGEPEPSVIEAEKGKLVGIERLLLETVCFNFGSGRSAGGKDLFEYVVAIGHYLRASKTLIHLAFRLAVDSYRTLVGLTYPPHIIALACLYLASFFDPEHLNYSFCSPAKSGEGSPPHFQPGWTQAFKADVVDIEDICHTILDLFISLAAPVKTHQSPTSPSDAQPRRVTSLSAGNSSVTPSPSATELTKLKIALRERSSETGDTGQPGAKRPKLLAGSRSRQESQDSQFGGSEVLGRDDVTVRFIFGANGS